MPTGRGKIEDLLSADEFEAIFAKLYELSKRAGFTSRRLKRNTTGATCCNSRLPSA